MLARIRKSMDEKDQGFTLIELLVVMIIIGILAAIAIPVFLTERAKARDTATKADISVLGKEIAAFYVDGTGALTLTVTSSTTGPGSAVIKSGTNTISTVALSAGTTAATVTNYTAGLGYGASCSSNWALAFYNSLGSGSTTGVWYYSGTGGLSQTAPTTQATACT